MVHTFQLWARENQIKSVKYTQHQKVVNEMEKDKIGKQDRKWGEYKTWWSWQASLRTWWLRWGNELRRHRSNTYKSPEVGGQDPWSRVKEREGEEVREVTGSDQGGPCGQVKRSGLFLWVRRKASGACWAQVYHELTQSSKSWFYRYFVSDHVEILH